MKIFKATYKVQVSPVKWLTVFTLFIFTLSFGKKAMAQEKNQMVRLAKIKVEPLQLEKYKVALKRTNGYCCSC